MRPASGFWSIKGDPLDVDDVEAWRKAVAEPVSRPLHPVKAAAQERNAVKDPRPNYIYGASGKIIGKVDGGKPVPKEHMPKKNESITPYYDSLISEDFTTGDVASFELPLRNGGLSQQFDKELDRRRKKKYYKLAMIATTMGGAGASY